jgi:hypothetical protein
MRASTAGSTFTDTHQHGESKLPVVAGTHPFGPPHRGHATFGFGSIVTRQSSG